jgi:hypothetical protein
MTENNKTATERLHELTTRDFAEFACLLDLFTDHPSVQENPRLYGAGDALKSVYVQLWEKVDKIADEE